MEKTGMFGKVNGTAVAVVFVAAFLMVSGTLIAAQGPAEGAATGELGYYTVASDGGVARLAGMRNVQIVKADANSAVIRCTESVKDELSNAFSVSEMPDRTRVQLKEAGIDFDSRDGYTVPEAWKAPGSELFLVQFVAPAGQDWLDAVRGKAQTFFDCVGDSLAIVKLTPAQKAQVEGFGFVEWVGAYEPYFKAYSRVRQETGDYNVRITPLGVSTTQLAQQLGTMGIQVLADIPGCNRVEARISQLTLPSVAKLDSVGLIEYKNKNIGDEVQQSSLSGETVGAHVVWDTARSNLPQQITGAGQVYHHQDLGLDNTHPDFTGRILYCQDPGDPDDHSTGCVGIAAGSGWCMETFLGTSTADTNFYDIAASNPLGMLDRGGMAGRAPQASIVAYDNLNLNSMTTSYTTYNSRVFSHSWANSGNVENSYFGDVDTWMLAQPKGLVVFCACNWGPNEGTVTGYGNCKNGLSVGAAENNRGDWFQTDDNPWGIWTSSTKGPASLSAADYRVKPDVLEVGAGVILPMSSDVTNGDDTLYRGANNDASKLVDANGDGRGDYRKNQGTSFSSPAAAGDCILIRDYLVDIKGYDNNPSEGTNEPDAGLIKAYLIQGARDMGYGYPSYGQGWGLCSPEYSIAPPAPLSNKDWSGTGTSSAMTVDVKSSAAPLKVTMVHWDTSTTSGALTVDYDLIVTAPDGSTKYYGNAFAESRSVALSTSTDWSACRFPTWSAFPSVYPTGYYDWDTANDGGDDINNVEVILVDAPAKGVWTIQVVQKSGTAVLWHVVASADFGPYSTYQVDVRQDSNVTYHMRDGYGKQSYQAPAGSTIAVGFTVRNYGTSSDTIALAASYQGDGYAPGSSLPLGWSVTFDTGASLSLASGDLTHVTAYVTSPGSATEGAYPIRLKATSGGSASTDYIVFNYDVVNQRLPLRVQVTNSRLPEMNPCIAVWNDYVVVSYLRDTGRGEQVFVSVSSNGGTTFGAPVQVTNVADDPQCIELKVAPTGHANAGRMFIGYNSLKPLANGDTWEQCTNRRCVVAYADAPYTTWTIRYPFNNGDGPDTYNDYREIDIGFYNPNQIFFIENNYYFGSSNNMNQQPNSISGYTRLSTDGGNTWGSGVSLSVGGSNQYACCAGNDGDGDLIYSCYMTGTDRMMYYRNYAGTWGAGVVAMTFAPNDAMWGYCGGDPVNNRGYVIAGYSSGTNYNDFKLPYVTYTDNEGTNWATPVGTLGGASNRCDNGHFDSNKMMDMDVTADSMAWATSKQHPTSTINRYWSYNYHSASSTYASGFAAYTNNQLTRDSFAKEPAFRAARYGNNLLVAYNAFETGPSDVYLLKVYSGWQTDATDTVGPLAKSLQAPDRWVQYKSLRISANVDEFNTGYHNIAAAQYRWDGGTAASLAAADGSYSGVAEGVQAIDPATLSVGYHWLEVRGQDSLGNWGAWAGKWVYIYSMEVPDYPTFNGLEAVVNPGTGTSLTLQWTAGSDPNGNEYPITYSVYRSTTPGFTPNNATNRIDTSKTSLAVDIGTPMTWSDTTVTAGTTYYYIVRAADAGGDPAGDPVAMDMNTEERSGTPESLVYFQVQSPAAGFRNLNTDSFEVAVQTGKTAVMTAAGEYKIDTASGKWRSSAVAANTDMSGTWRFYVNGLMNNTNANGFLYAKVYRNSDTQLLFTTAYDNEDIAGFQTYHQFVWTHTVTAGTLSLTAGDSYYVELWIHVTAVTAPGGGAQVVYDFSSGAATNKWYYDCSWTASPPVGLTPAREQELTAVGGAYSQIAATDATLSTSVDAGNGRYAGYKIPMNLAETPTQISSIDMTYTAGTAASDTGYMTRLYVWNWAAKTWLFISEAQLPRVTSTGTLSGTLSSATTGFTQWSDYVNASASNRFLWMAFHTRADGTSYQTRLQCDYCKATVTKVSTPDGQFTFGYDSSAAPSAVHPELPPSGGPTPQAYNIDLAGRAANSWVFVSFPIAISGDIQTILNDATLGDAGTAWSIAKWYNPQTPSDPWKSYRSGGTANDMPTFTNQMGVWLYLTANGGNQMLTTAATGLYPASSVSITLYQGWNQVGYPSATSRLASATLPAQADVVSVYSASAAYTEYTDKSLVTMQAGRAYFIRVTATCTWTVAP